MLQASAVRMSSVVVVVVFAAAAWSADTPAVTTWNGLAGCSKCDFAATTKATECGAAFKQGNDVYRLKTADDAPQVLKDLLVQVEKGTLKGHCTVKGTVSTDDAGVKWIEVQTLQMQKKDTTATKNEPRKTQKKH